MRRRRTKHDWIRGFAAQGMSREEIMGLLGVSRFNVNNALNRPLSADNNALPVAAKEQCGKCGAAAFEQEPSRIGQGRRCGACGSHYRYWSDRRAVPSARYKLPPTATPLEQRDELRAIVDARRSRLTAKPKQQPHAASLAPRRKIPATSTLPDNAMPVVTVSTAPDQEPAQELKPIARCDGVTPPPKRGRPTNFEQRDKAEARAAAKVGVELRERFENGAWHHEVKDKTTKQKALQEAADEWLRKHDSKMLVENPTQLALEPEVGCRPWSGGHTAPTVTDTTDYRAEIRNAAAAGDTYAAWRALELFDAVDVDEEEDEEKVRNVG